MGSDPRDENDLVGREASPKYASMAKDVMVVCTECKQSTMAHKGVLKPECRYCGAMLDRYSLVSLDGFPIEVGRPASSVEFLCSTCKLPIVWMPVVGKWVHKGARPESVPNHPVQYGNVEVPQMVQPISLKDASGPVTVLTRVYQLGDPDQRKQFDMDSRARDWASAVWSIWDRMCKERDDCIEGSGSNEGIAAYGVLQEAIKILNEELEERGLDLEVSCR